MADSKLAVRENVAGPFFVDRTCIDCDACRQLAPSVFGDGARTSFVAQQPRDAGNLRAAQQAVLACPVGAIGDRDHRPNAATHDFPLLIDGDLETRGVAFCGFNARASYGGNSYLIVHPDGNWLVDSPRFVRPLVERIAAFGGLRFIFLTHRDDVADAAEFAAHFGAQRIIHEGDRGAAPGAEIVIEGSAPVAFAPEFTIIPTPGHTRGHCVLLHERYLFTGDHLAYDTDAQRLVAWRDVCWYSWPKQLESLEKLAAYDFTWVLPGHGKRIHQSPDVMRTQLHRLVERAA
ncbi:MAG TPA: MBL fold metallo-hydrolase [Candidatus Binatia bacterium]|nr:MBL fold metallo-hydrolase [Candidatus Binatia bacterium]